jgi:acid stress-induced BolA-like protein IbaG/YrbA
MRRLIVAARRPDWPVIGLRTAEVAATSQSAARRRFERVIPTAPQETQKMDSTTVQNLIQQGLPEAKVEVHGPDGVHFEALVVSPAFAGKLPLARHRMVYATLGELMGGAIHALSLRTLTPEEAARG